MLKSKFLYSFPDFYLLSFARKIFEKIMFARISKAIPAKNTIKPKSLFPPRIKCTQNIRVRAIKIKLTKKRNTAILSLFMIFFTAKKTAAPQISASTITV